MSIKYYDPTTGTYKNVGVQVDDHLDSQSTNPVQNKVVKQALDDHINNTDNPHSVTKSQVGLSNVRNVEILYNSSSNLPDKEALSNIVDNTTGIKYEVPQGTYSKPSGGIPKTDLATAVQASLSKADNAMPLTLGDLTGNHTIQDSDYIPMASAPDGDAQKVNLSDFKRNITSNIYTKTEVDSAISAHHDSTKLNASEKGANGGVAELDANGKVPSSQLPSYVDDVLAYASQSAFPATGEDGKIYIANDTNKTYRWSGSAYVEISPSLALGETSSTAYRGDRGASAYAHISKIDNPHSVTKAQVGLGNVDNTSDLNKPISTATQGALDGKVDKVSGAVENNLASLSSGGGLKDSGIGVEQTTAMDVVTSISSSPTDTQIPTAKAVNDKLTLLQNAINQLSQQVGTITNDLGGLL